MVSRYDFWIKRYARCPALAVYYGIYSIGFFLATPVTSNATSTSRPPIASAAAYCPTGFYMETVLEAYIIYLTQRQKIPSGR